MAQKPRLLLGAHMSIAGGFDQALIRGQSINCTTIQIFTKSNRQWNATKIDPEKADLFKKTQKNTGISPIVVHATYLINIGSSDKEIHKKSVAAVIDELNRCEKLGVDYFVLHPGSAGTAPEQTCLNIISDSLNTIFEKQSGSTMLLLENMAGQGSVTCHRFESLAYIHKQSDYKKRLGFCLDTCHAFSAGYDFRTSKTYESFWKEFDDILGLSHLKVIHLNDSKKELGSHVDRHEEIGQGQLGLEPFSLLMNDERLFSVAKILETPKDDLEDYAKNMAILKKLISAKNKKLLGIE